MKKKQKNNRTTKPSLTANKDGKQDQHGIISIVQSPDDNKNESDAEPKLANQNEHGIISTVQAP